MKICLLGNISHPHSSEQHHAQALADLGHDLTLLQEGKTTAEQLVAVARGADLLVWIHTHGWDTPGGISPALAELRSEGVRVIAYHLDLWFGLEREKDLTEGHPYLSEVDHFFTVDPGMASWLTANTSAIGHYLPAAVSHRECWMSQDRRDLDVAFVGSHNYHPAWPYRNELIARLHMRYGNDFHLIPGHRKAPIRGAALNRLYARTKVCVGDTLCPGFDYPGYWSDRVYETLGRGGMMIHPRIPGMDLQFSDRNTLVYYDYNDWSTLFDLIDHYLRFPVDREAIRHKGHAEVHRAHTYVHRWQTILETIE